jgi:hypothetical protein
MKTIDVKTAKKMVDHYHATRKDIIDKKHGINDTKSVWFDIAAFKDFVNKLPAHATGVRIHLASYDEAHAQLPNQTTVVLAGTVNKESSHIDAVSDSSVLTAGLEPTNGGKDCPPTCI